MILIRNIITVQSVLETMKTLTLFFLTPYELSEEYIYLISSLLNFAGGYREVEIPRSIPNREVKPLMADGTGIPTGRVGSRHIYSKPLIFKRLFFCICSTITNSFLLSLRCNNLFCFKLPHV